jgi:glycerate kinase
MLSALGYKFLDKSGNEIPLGAKGLEVLEQIDTASVNPLLKECTFRIACDVTNPLCGENGCSAVFGPQKGADSKMVMDMDLWLGRYAEIAKTVSDTADAEYEGAGAAGGLGFAFLSFTNAKLEKGIKIILEQINLEEKIIDADLVITGEGRLDGQTIMGKAPIGVARLAKKYGKKVIAFAGCVTDEAEICNQNGIDAFFPIVQAPTTLADAMNKENAYRNLMATAEQTFRLIRSIQK